MILPFAILSIILAFWKLENVMDTRKVSLDYFSIVLSVIGFGGILYGCSMASSNGWGDTVVLTTIIVGAVALFLFITRQFKLEEPLLDLRVYKYPMFALGSVISMVNAAALFSGMILTPAYVQDVRGIDPLESGLMMLPGAIIMGVMSPITGKLFDKFGPRILAVIGLGITAISTFMLAGLDLESSYAYIIGIYTIRMFGMSMVMMPIMTNGLNQLPTRLNPHGTAVNNTAQQVIGSIGTAIFVTIMTSAAATRGKELAASMDPASMTEEAMKQIQAQSLLHGVQLSFIVAAVVTCVALVLSFFLKRVDVSANALADIEKEVKS
jgi:EmrB/QacA subfamily drug resistance transporter